jgi:hypothetical protein
MANIKAFILSLTLVVIGFAGFGQRSANELVKQRIIETCIEQIAENLEEGEEIDFTTLLDDLNDFYARPVNLNKASREELERLYLINEQQIISLFVHIARFGPLEDIHELQAIQGWDLNTIYTVLPFVRVSGVTQISKLTFKEALATGKHDVFLRYQTVLEEQRGFINEDGDGPQYPGSNDKLYARYRYRLGQTLSIGLTAEKDAGEEFFVGSQKQGFDFYSAHLFYSGEGLVKKFVVGDYQLNFGQGLTLWSGLAFGKSAQSLLVRRSSAGLRPYTSVDENLFLRGAAVTIGLKDVELTIFYSQNKVDANVVQSSDSLENPSELVVSSFQTSGFHRTPAELFDKDAISQQFTGAHLEWKTRRVQLGLSALDARWNSDVERNLQLYNQFELNSEQSQVAGMDYAAVIRNFNFFGETGLSSNGGWGTVNGVMAALNQALSIAVVNRHYERDFHSPLGNPFMEGSRPANESGTYIGAALRLNQKWYINTYADFYDYRWLKFAVDAPSQGRENLTQLTYKPSRRAEFYARWRTKSKWRNYSTGDAEITVPLPSDRQNFRINASFQAHPNIRLKSRVEWVNFQLEGQEKEDGFLIYQDVNFKKIQSPFSFSLRYALFQTDSYNARIYAYENDVLYFFSIPAYYSTGSRFYVVTKYHIARGVDMWVRYARWMYEDRQTVGSGYDAVSGPFKSDVRVQLRIRF